MGKDNEDSLWNPLTYTESLVEGVTDGIGLTDNAGQREKEWDTKNAMKKAESAQERANKIAERNQEFAHEQYAEWQNVFGSLQENLGNYYKNLGPEKVATLGLQRHQQAHQQAVKKIKQNLARQGRGGSKFEDYLLANADIQSATEKANIISQAEEKTMQQKLNFLGLGVNQKQAIVNNVHSANQVALGARQGQAATYTSHAGTSNQQFLTTQNNNAKMVRQLADDATTAATSPTPAKKGGGG